MATLDRIASHPGWCALALGAIAALGFEPLHLWPLSLLALAGQTLLIRRAKSGRQAAFWGWLFGMGHFAVGNTWIATAFTYQAQMPAWLGWIAVVALAVYLAVYPALATWAAWRLGRACRLALPMAFAGSWIITEWLRSWVFTGFVWNPLGMALMGPFEHAGLARLAPWLGTYGLSGLVIVLAGLVIAVFSASLTLRVRLAAFAGLFVAVLAMVFPIGAPLSPAARPGAVAFSLVQPNIPQELLNEPEHFEDNFARVARETVARPPGRRLVLWPESGVQDYLRDGYPPSLYWDSTFGQDPALARGRLARIAGRDGMLLTGAVDLDIRGDTIAGARNVVTVLDATGAIRGSYAKAHLVPYGEYLPLRWLLEPLGASRLVPGSIDFLPGPGPQTLDLGAFGKAGFQICYEIIFSGQVVDRAHRPDYLFNPSNDGWFGAWGPPQHLAQARMRAVEEGLPVLRATTTGISAVIDAQGRVLHALPRQTAGRIDGVVPPALPPTLFARLGNVLPLGWAIALLVLSLVASRRRRG